MLGPMRPARFVQQPELRKSALYLVVLIWERAYRNCM
jgi:hypothetical protein